MRINRWSIPTLLVGVILLAPAAAFAQEAADAASDGRYLVRIAGCNDCHTAGFGALGGSTPEQDWLTGNPVGYRGPWGTTYAANLRLSFQDLAEDQWVKTARNLKTRPPMPWFSITALKEADARAIHAFIRSLGPKGDKVPPAVPPGGEPTTPFILMMPQSPK